MRQQPMTNNQIFQIQDRLSSYIHPQDSESLTIKMAPAIARAKTVERERGERIVPPKLDPAQKHHHS